MRSGGAIVPEKGGARLLADDGVMKSEAMGGFFAERDQVSGAYQMGLRAVSASLHERRIQRAGTMSGGGTQQPLAIAAR